MNVISTVGSCIVIPPAPAQSSQKKYPPLAIYTLSVRCGPVIQVVALTELDRWGVPWVCIRSISLRLSGGGARTIEPAAAGAVSNTGPGPVAAGIDAGGKASRVVMSGRRRTPEGKLGWQDRKAGVRLRSSAQG
jgi:hypothetical protein